ncbi:MAG: alpha/beta hydrolase [Proteobacteria bacterium]|nr:alpha/beta hydrolase [Pseudomonadota bacterium]
MSWVSHPFTFQSEDGLTLAGERAGPRGAQPVIFMHGGGQTRHSWRRAVREVAARGYDVINLDARGHGESQWAGARQRYRMEYLSSDLLRIIDTLSAPPVLIGASMGGLTAMHALGREPSRQLARALILVDVVPRIEPDGAARIIGFMRARPEGFANVEEAAAAVAAYNPHRPPPMSAQGLMKNLRRDANGRLRWHWDPAFVSTMGDESLFDSQAMLQGCGQFRNPALLVRGMHSDILTDEGIRELREVLPQLELIDVAGAGHMIAGDRNDAFNAAVLDFLSRLPGAPAAQGKPHERHG